MLIGYEANNVLRNGHELGEYGRELVSGLAKRHSKDYRALLFSTRIKEDYRGYFSGNANVSTYLPAGGAKLLPSAWMRYRLNPWLKEEKVRLFHGLNEELPYHISRDIKTVITCYGRDTHHHTSVMDILAWRLRMRYSFGAADAIVAVSEKVRRGLLELDIPEKKIVVIGGSNPLDVDDAVVEQYFELYRRLLNAD